MPAPSARTFTRQAPLKKSPEGSTWKTVMLLELRDGLIASLTGYFSEPFAAPDWRKPFRSRP